MNVFFFMIQLSTMDIMKMEGGRWEGRENK
jgi:hypothetical protein